jgi:hypothetical protein
MSDRQCMHQQGVWLQGREVGYMCSGHGLAGSGSSSMDCCSRLPACCTIGSCAKSSHLTGRLHYITELRHRP